MYVRKSPIFLIKYYALTELAQYINGYFGVPKEEIAGITSFFQLTTLAKGEYFLKAGRICDKLSFHKSGLLRIYATTAEKEITQWISSQGYFVTDLAGIIFDKPSKWNIVALADCEFYTIDKKDYNNIGQHLPQWHLLEKLFIARCFNLMEDRVFNLLSMTAEQRYKAMQEQHGELFNQVPLQYLASMMGMTPETLSRLRRKAQL